MRNILITLKYMGTNYHGFQVQKNANTVCEEFQNAVEKVLRKRFDVKGCSRTDSGVHANMYCLSMMIDSQIPCSGLIAALNRNLPDDICVCDAREMSLDFHARYNCIGKEYVYVIHNSCIKDPFSAKLSYQYHYPLDENFLNEQAQDFVGTHDFASFCSAGSDIQDTVRTIHAFKVERNGDKVLFTVSGDGFLYNMVRIMIGTLLFISMGRIEPNSVPDIIKGRNRQLAGKTMPPWGLYLNRVFYDTTS